MTNPYKKHLDSFFATVLGFRHSTKRLEKVLKKDVEIFTEKGAIYHSGSALIISDWSRPSDNTSSLKFHTGIFKETTKENYESEINQLLSRECCLIYSQSFEALETFIKNCLFELQLRNSELNKYIIYLTRKQNITREYFPSRDKLFKILKKAGGKSFREYSKHNINNIQFKELWNILSETRHSITHTSARIQKNKVDKSKHHFEIFNILFDSSNFDNDYLQIELDYEKLDRLIKILSEFAFQILKSLSIEENIDWKVYK